MMRSPLFGLLSRIPGSGIGSTVYSRCDEVAVLPNEFLSRLAPALATKFSERSDVASRLTRLVRGLSESSRFELLLTGNSADTTNFLRLPLLAGNREARDSVVTAMNERGLGASSMYGTPLPQVDRIPVHQLVTDDHIEAMQEVLSSELSFS
jgi:hypothetical protein